MKHDLFSLITAELNEGLQTGDRKVTYNTTVIDDRQKEVAVTISYKFTYVEGKVCDFFCEVTPLTDYVMDLQVFKEVVQDLIHDEIKYYPDFNEIGINK